jgi:hypothetical protein
MRKPCVVVFMTVNINCGGALERAFAMNESLHSPQRHLIELRMAHADLDQLIDAAGAQGSIDELALKRLKKRRLMLRDQISQLESALSPPEKA